jgi:hypothetical protein
MPVISMILVRPQLDYVLCKLFFVIPINQHMYSCYMLLCQWLPTSTSPSIGGAAVALRLVGVAPKGLDGLTGVGFIHLR